MDKIFLQLKKACASVTKTATAEAQSKAGVYGAQAQALLAISKLGECKITDLADQLELGKPNITTLVGRLKTQQLISTHPDPNDKRSTLLVLTAKGRSALKGVVKMIDTLDTKLLEGFSAKDIETIERFLFQASKIRLRQKD